MKPYLDHLAEQEKRMFARLLIFIGLLFALTALLTPLFVAVTAGVIVGIVIAGLTSIVLGVIGEYLRHNSQSEINSCFTDIHKKRLNKSIFDGQREQAKYETIKGHTLFGDFGSRLNGGQQGQAPLALLDQANGFDPMMIARNG